MANQIKYNIGFEVQQQSLNQLKTSLQQLQKMKLSDIMKINDSDISSARESFKQISDQAREVEKALDAAFNTKLNTFNIQTFNQELSKSHLNLNQVYETFSQAGAKGETAFRNLAMQISSTNVQLRESHQILDKVAETFANSAKWHIASSAVNSVTRSIEQAWGYTKALDSSLNDIRIVTGKSADQMANFAVQANEAAKSLGKTTTDYTNAALIYAQQGLSDADIEERAKITLKTANVTGQSTDEVSEQLTAVWNGYKATAEEAELYVDRLAAVAATSASDLEELSTGMSKVASAAAAMGVGEDKLAAQLATIISVTRQAPESVGTALRTIYARISDIQAGMDEEGVTLGRYSGKMASMGIDVLDVNNKLRDMGDVMEEIGAKWDTMTREQQVYLAQTMAGQRQYNNLLALFDNFEQYNKELAIAQGAAGTLQEQQDIYMESTAAHLKVLKASVEGIYNSLADTDTIDGLIDALAHGATLIENLVDSLGGGVGILSTLGTLGVTVFSQQIGTSIQTSINNIRAQQQETESLKRTLEEVQELQKTTPSDPMTQSIIDSISKIANMSGKLPVKDIIEMRQALLNLVQAANNATILNEKIEILRKGFEAFGVTSDDIKIKYGSLDEMLATSNGAEQALRILRRVQGGFRQTEEFAEIVGQEMVDLMSKVSNPTEFNKSFENMKKTLTDFINLLKTIKLGEGGPELFNVLPEYVQNSLTKAQEKIKQLETTTFTSTDQAGNKVLGIFRDVTVSVGTAVNQTEELIRSATDNTLAGIQAGADQASKQAQNLQNDVKSGIEYWFKTIKTQDMVNFASGISRVAMGIQQVQNLGSIWKNSDLSGGQRLLQTITNLSFSLPMLVTGLKTLGVFTVNDAAAFKLFGAQAVQAGYQVQFFNTTLTFTPWGAWLAAITAIVAGLGLLVNALDEANEARQKEAKEAVEAQQKTQEQIESNKQLYSSIEEINKKYQNGQITRAELKSSVQELINKYDLESESVKNLTKDYDNLADSIQEARKTAAQQGFDSAKRQRENAENQVISTAKGKTFDNSKISGENYLLNLSGAFSENSDIISAMQRAGAVRDTQETILFKTGSSIQEIVDLYDTISNTVKEIQDTVDNADRANSKYFQGMKDWLAQMQEPVEHYKDALENISLYGTELAGFSSDRFDNVTNASDYLTKRAQFIEEVRKMLQAQGASTENAESTVDTYLSKYFKDAYDQYDQSARYIEEMRKRLPDSKSQEQIEKLISSLDADHLDILTGLDSSTIKSWDSLRDIIQRISKIDLENIASITENPQEMMEAAADRYNVYQSLEDQVKNGKNVSKTEYQSLDPELQSYFSMMANGTFKMTGDAQEFYKTVNDFKLDGFLNTLAAAEQRLNQINTLQEKGFDYDSLNKQAFTGGFWGLGKSIDYDTVNEQLDYLNVAVEDSNVELKEQINIWQDLAEKNKLNADHVKDIAKEIENVGDKTKNLEQDQKALEEITRKTAQQLHDAMFPTDEDVDTSALESLSKTIQSIADQSNELSTDLNTNKRDAEDVAEAILRFDNAITDVVDNYDDWIKALNSGSIQEQAEIVEALRDAYADLLDLDGTSLSDDFLTDADNLNLMKAAIDGNTDAYDKLMQLAQQDIATQIGLDTTQFDAGFDHLMDLYYQGQNLDDMQIGASLDNQNFLAGLTEMVNAAGMTAQQATDYLASMGVDAQVIEQKNEAQEVSEAAGFHPQASGRIDLPYSIPFANGLLMDTVDGQGYVTGVQYVPDPVSITTTKENKAFSLKVTSAHKSSGGKFKYTQAANGAGSKGAARRAGSGKKSGGGGKKGGSKKAAQPDTSKKDTKKNKEDQRDIYHDINIELEQLNRELERVQKEQDKLYGKDLIDNLTKQIGLLEQHKELLEEKHELQQQDLKSQRETLENLGVTFDEYGNISNYLSILAQKQAEINDRTKDYNNLIEAYNESTNKDMKKNIADEAEAINKHIKQLEDDYKDLESKIKNYDGLRQDMEDLVDQIEEETQKQVELNIKKFRTELEIRLDMGEAERDWNEFRREVLEHTDVLKDTDFDKIFGDALKDARDMTSYFNVDGSIGSLEMLTDQLMNTRAQIEAINETGKSAIYGDNKAQAMEDLQKDLDELAGQMEDVKDLIDNIDEAYLDTADDIEKQFDKQIDDYEYVGELIEHNIDLLGLLYGDKNYDAMQKYYSTLERNNLKQLDSLKQQRDFWREQWEGAVARGDTKAAEQFEKNYKDTISNLNKAIEDAAKTIEDKYVNAIDKIFDELDKKISNGHGTDYLNDSWELMNKNADEYLDTINSAFAIQDIERKYQQALNNAPTLKNQQALKDLMDEQLGILRNKEKITQYDIDRAEKLLQVEQARAALEDAQAAKTSMRLRRDSQGNYSYEYVADNDAIDDARGNLADAQNDLYNFDKDRYKANLDDMLAAWKEFQSEYKDIITDTALSEQQRVEKLALLRDQYGEYINDKTAENLVIRNNLMDSAFADLAALYNTDVANYNQMSIDEQNILMGDLVPAWKSGIQQMADTVAGEGGFIPVCEDAFESLEDQTLSYQESLEELADAAGINLQDIQDGVYDLADEFENLIEKNDDLLERMNYEMLAIESLRAEAQSLVNDYNNVYSAAAQAVTQLHDFVQAERAAAAAYAQTAAAYENMVNRIQKANAAYAANPYGSYSYNGGNNSGSDNSGGGGSGSSSGAGGSGSGSSNKGSNKASNSSGYKSDGIVNGIMGGNYYKKYYYDTGGYTGNWNSKEGKLAVLHQKEQVFNEEDTSKLLSAAKILRSISENMNISLFTRTSSLSYKNLFSKGDSNGTIEQDVHIEATFPNVDSKKEIEEALTGLVSAAAQRAMRR